MPDGLQLLQQSMQLLDEAIRALPDPESVNALTTCLSNMAAVQQKLMQQPQQDGGARQALVGQLGGAPAGAPGPAY